ncbi:lysosomal-trafficking regulator, partial [Parasteatoda tepidariorum]|uniref:lysosomal-trafficking regulator n=1 Tax=Parasteatoda tepidariorum TaxID=114398 RepID=UPI0039BC4E64
LAAIFVGFGGVRMLHQFILLPEFRRASLLVFKILISSECVNGMEIDDENKSATFSQYPTSNTFSLLLLERTSNFHQKFETLLHSKYNKNLSSSTSSLFEDTTVLDSSNVVINEEEISILCDLWKCYQEIASDLSNEYFCFVISEKSFRSGYCMFFTLLENLNVVLTEQTVEEKPAIAKYLLLLTQNLLSVCVTNMREKSERISFLEEVKLDLIKHFPNYVKHLGLLFNFILKCCFSTPFFVSTSSHLKLQDAFDVIDDTTSSSGTETHSNESYCGDTEGSNGNLNNKKALYEMSYQCVIEHAEIVAILIELLIHFQSEHSNEWSESALHVMQVLKKMCQDCEFNRVVLCKQGISSLLLQSLGLSFKDLPCDSINYQTMTMELFVILSKCRISAADLEMLINFFKYPHAPLPLLLKSLNDMVEDMSPHPVWSVSFPSPKFSDSTDRVKKRLKKCFNIHLKSVSPSPWTEAAMCFPLSEDTRWNNGFTKGFCCSLWLKIDSTKDLKMSTPKISDEDLCRSELHVISFGSDKFLLELWYNTWDNDLIIRINSYNNGEMICLSKGVCKSLFQMNMWHHLTLNYIESSPKSLINCRVQIVVDGTKGNIFNLSFNRIGNTTTDFYVLLGHTKDNLDDETLPSNYSIGSFMLFKGDVLTREVIFYLASLGPNSINISKCALLNQNMFVPKETPSWSMSSLVDLDVILGLKTPSLEPLQNSLVCCYTAENKDSYLVYPVTPRGFFPLQVSFSSGGNSKLTSLQDGIYSKMPIELQVLVFGKISQKEYRTLQSAILQAGGSAIFLLLFAYIYFFQLFLQNCLKFDSKLNITALASEEVISEQSSLAISNGAIFSVMLKSHPFAKNISPNTVAALFLLIERLLNPKSTKFRINSIQMNHINVLDILLWIIKRHCIMGEGFLPLKALQVIPSIMQKLLLYNFNGLIFENICHFMLLLHESSATYVCHSRSAFFFLRPVDKIGYEKKVDSSTWYIDSSSDFYPLQPSFPSYNRSLLSKRQLSVPNEQMVPFQKKLPKVKSADDLLLTEEEITSSDPETSSDQTSSLEEKFSKSIEEDIGKEFPILMSVLEVKNKEKSAICIGLLQLIHGFILKSYSTNIQHPSGIIQLEVFIVLANAVDSEVCAFALKIIQAYLFEANEDTKNAFLKMKGFHLLANQLNVRTFDMKVFDVCFSLISGVPLSSVIECNMFLSKEASGFQIMSWLPFLAVLPSSYLEPSLCEKAILLLIKFLRMDCSVIVELLNNGLMMSISSLISCICHSSEKKIADNLHAPMEALHCLLKAVSYELCSSKNGKHFYALSNSVNLFTALEKKCLEECGADSHCLLCWRKCLCHIYQIIFEFSETPSFHPPIEHSPIRDKASSVWELLSELQESLGTFSAHHAAVSTDDIQQQKSTADIDVDKFWRDVPTSEVIKRLESLVEAITHFIVFKDPRIKISHYEREFVKSFFNFCMKAISSTIVRNINTAKQEYSNLMFCIKDSLKNQLGLLIFSFLSPSQDVFIKEYVVDVLSTHPLSSKILRLVIFTITKVEILFAFLVDLQVNPEMQIKRNGILLYKIVKEILREDARVVDLFRQPQVIQKLKLEWVKLWNEDRLKWYAALNNSNEKLFQKFESLAQDVSSIAFNMTQKVFEIQNNERKHFIEELKRKYYEEASERRIWLRLIEQMTHEKAVWYQNDLYPNSWELDPTEGPSRVRRRFKRCFLNLDSRFLRVDTQTKLNRDLPFVNLLVNRNEFPDSAAVLHRLHSHEQIQYTSPCKIVTAFDEAKVEVLVGAYHIHLIGEETSSYGKISQISESWPFETIKEIVPRRYELQNNAFEIFLTNGLTYLIAFESEKEYHHIWKQLESHDLPCKSNVDVSILTQLWRERALTNFEYLTQLNKLSGRSFNDLMQYPVFPFVLSDYGSSYLDLCNPSVYRNLEKPVAVQHKYREKFYMDTYELLKEQASCSSSTEFELPISGPYHYGSHYSNSGTVLHFLIRILPFTYSFIKYQDNNFDIPDRTFHSIETSWQLVTKDSTSDVKELIPEFFFLPEFLCNKNDFDFGVRQSGIRVNDVLLPPWCKQNPRLFVLIHRQVLESENVTRSIHNWIDLVFGCKQTGEAAFSAINVFHPATYYGLDINQWKDPITKQAVQVMIKTLGQMPKQLFTSPHPMVSIPFSAFSVSNEIAEPMEVVDTVNGLHWGNYVGSPSTAAPSLVWCRKQKVVLCNLLPLLANYIFGLGENICLILNHRKNPGSNVSSATYIMSAALVSWGHKDNVIRIKLCRDQPAIPLLKENSLDPVCLCASVPDCRELFVAHLSGTIFVYTLSLDSNNLDRLQRTLPLQLKGHTDTITSICICKPFSVFVSGSKDKSVIVWDLNKLCYVRTLTKHEESIDLVCVSDTLGDVASISNEDDQGHLKVCTINGESIGCVNIPDVVTAMCYSTAPEGISVNVIATGMRCGNICLWSSWDLKPVREIICDKFHFPIKCLVFSSDNQHLFASNENGTVAVWEKPSKGLSNVPRLLIFT